MFFRDKHLTFEILIWFLNVSSSGTIIVILLFYRLRAKYGVTTAISISFKRLLVHAGSSLSHKQNGKPVFF